MKATYAPLNDHSLSNFWVSAGFLYCFIDALGHCIVGEPDNHLLKSGHVNIQLRVKTQATLRVKTNPKESFV